MDMSAINLKTHAQKIKEHWKPLRVAQLNNYDFKLTIIKGDFVWHTHNETDEAFFVVSGEMRIDFRNGSVRLKAGELFVVPKGVEHKPFAADVCTILLIEPRGTLNTGNIRNERTVYNPDV